MSTYTGFQRLVVIAVFPEQVAANVGRVVVECAEIEEQEGGFLASITVVDIATPVREALHHVAIENRGIVFLI